MTKTKTTIAAASVFCAALFAIGGAPIALAGGDDDERFYLGAGIAQFTTRRFDNCTARCQKDDSRLGFTLYGGYRANDYFGAEVGANFVKGLNATERRAAFGGDNPLVNPPFPTEFRTESKYGNIYAAGTARAPIMKDRAYLTGKFGMHYYRRKEWYSIVLYPPGGLPPVIDNSSSKASSIQPLFGIGAELRIGDGDIRADWTKFFGESGKNDGIETIAVNYIYRF